MDILVGDLAKLYGISSQTLHYYEEKEILHPKRDLINGYRYYEVSDLSRLGTIKKYRNADFPLSEAVELYDYGTEAEISAEYNKQKKLLWEEIEKRQYIIRQLDEDLSLYLRCKENSKMIMVEELEGFLRFESLGAQIIFQNQHMRNEATPWFKNIFYTAGSQMFYINKETNKILSSTNGMLATLSTAKFLDLKITKNVEHIKGGRFVTSIINTNLDEDFEKVIYNCMDYIKNNDLETRGNPFTKTVFIFKDGDNANKLLEQVLVPIK